MRLYGASADAPKSPEAPPLPPGIAQRAATTSRRGASVSG